MQLSFASSASDIVHLSPSAATTTIVLPVHLSTCLLHLLLLLLPIRCLSADSVALTYSGAQRQKVFKYMHQTLIAGGVRRRAASCLQFSPTLHKHTDSEI